MREVPGSIPGTARHESSAVQSGRGVEVDVAVAKVQSVSQPQPRLQDRMLGAAAASAIGRWAALMANANLAAECVCM